MDKAPDAYRTISEVADDLDLQQHVLRFWESRFSQIRPLKRGGGRRYYRPDDVELLKGIRHLLYKEGYTIKGVQRILKEQGVRAVQAFARAGQTEVTFEPAEEAPLAAMPSPAMPTPTSFASPPVNPPPVNPPPMHMAPQAEAPSFPAEDEPGENEPDDFTSFSAPVMPEASMPSVAREAEAPPFAVELPVQGSAPAFIAPAEAARGQVSMFRGGLQRGEAGADPALSADLSERMRAQLATSHEAREVPAPGLPANESLRLALEELLACRARIDQILARR